MISLEEAQRRLLDGVQQLDSETVSLSASCHRILARDLNARWSSPPFDTSSMDGYATAPGDGRWRIVGTAAAGSPYEQPLHAGEAVRIFTGAPLPSGADAILLQEDAVVDGDRLASNAGTPQPSAWIRRKGQDFVEGHRIARAGTRITPALIGLLATAGYYAVPVARRPRVAILATGDELVSIGEAPVGAQIINANGPMLAVLFRTAGAETVDLGIVPDDLDAIVTALAAAEQFDLLVTVGGASVGDHDLVRPALERAGATIDFWKVAVRPGKPTFVGTLGQCRILGLPGNPVSAYVCALLFGLPMIRALQGDDTPLPALASAITAQALAANGPRQDYIRAVLKEGTVTPAPVQDSAMLSVLAASNALIVRPPHAPPVAAGEQVVIIRLDSDPFAS